ncbi:PDZ domain-containing protein [Paraliomyxa miuraensis]|uniref:hypothetical protein n=1 Tax=Paraliomyxa miuraensis TaxID=376150 RepID=UPI00224F81EC|nr:hypothetical protein [Paraliomyxa miuraensis]MCX4242530.1 hypothetical protein [Paraliomyxa miuraensis]
MKVPRTIVMVAAVAAGAGCKLLDDDEPPLPMGTGGEAGGSCIADAIEAIGAACPPPRQWWVDHSGGTSKAIAIDDPSAWVGVGPGAWVVQVSSSADFVGTYIDIGEECTPACGWCMPGEHACHAGYGEGGLDCVACLPLDTPDVVESCAIIIEACLQGGGEGLDETGAGTSDGIAGYDCSWWHPEDGVERDGGTVTVDAALIEEALLYQGEPIASCDGTRFRAREDGHFVVSRLGEQGLAVAMGLELGDALLAIDGQTLNSIDAMMNAASKSNGAGSFVVTLERAGEPIELSVVVD